jgi:hypothetical protein
VPTCAEVIKIYKGITKDKTNHQTVIRPKVMYGLEVWTLRKSDENILAIWERKIP